jgi:hypothetical protein
VGNEEAGPSGSDSGGLLADLLEGARRRNLSANSLAAYERTWRAFLAWAAAASFDPRSLSFPTAVEAYRFLGEGKNAASLKQIRAALSFTYKHWELKNPFAKIEQPLQNEPQIRYLLLIDIRRLLDYLKARQQGWGKPNTRVTSRKVALSISRPQPRQPQSPTSYSCPSGTIRRGSRAPRSKV